MPTQQMPQAQLLTQLIQQSTQPSILIDIDSDDVIMSNALCLKLFNIKKTTQINPVFHQQLLKKAHQLINKGLLFFNYEIFYANKIFLIIAEVRGSLLIIYLQEKFNHNMPSSHLINILDSLGAYVYCKDTDYRFTYANKMVGSLFGVDHLSMIGKIDSDFFGIPGAKKIREEFDTLVINKKSAIEKEEHIYIPNLNKEMAFISVKKPLIGKNNEVVGLFGISTDISEYKAIEKKIRLNEEKLNTILDNVGAYIYIKDLNLKLTYVNKMTIGLFNLKEEEILGYSTDELFGEEAGEGFRHLDEKLLKENKVISGIEKLPSEDVDLFYWTVKAPLYDEDNKLTGLIGMSTDISEQKKLEKKLEQSNNELQYKIDEITKLQATLWEQATQDPLTQLFNRRYFNEISKNEILKAERSGNPLALLLIDADHFKKVNDAFGHNIGDQVLIKLAEIMRNQCRQTDIICRFGGEEFVILMPEIDKKTGLKRAESIRICYQKEITELLEGHKSTLSIGLAMWNADLIDLEGLTKAADQAMYQAKHNGRNQVIIYNADSINQ